MGEPSNGQKGPKETAITVGLGWDSPRGPWVEERLSPHPPTSGGKVGEGIEAGFLLRRHEAYSRVNMEDKMGEMRPWAGEWGMVKRKSRCPVGPARN